MEALPHVSNSDSLSSRPRSDWRLGLVPWLVGAIQLLATLGHWLNNVPLTRLLELNLCRAYYLAHDPSFVDPDGNVEERFCKLDSVQESLAFYLGLLSTLELVCELIATIPLGYVSDKLGRKFVLLLNSVSAILAIVWYICVANFYETFPITAIVAGPFLFLFSGFYNVLGANLNALVADITDSSAQRTTIFSWTQCGSQIVSLLGPAISSTALLRSLWLPFGLGIGCLALIIPCVLLLPETRPWLRKPTSPRSTRTEAVLGDGRGNDVSEESPLLSDASQDSAQNGETAGSLRLHEFLRKKSRQLVQSKRDLLRLIRINPSFPLCLLIFLFTTLSKQSINILLQYTSKKFNVSFAEAGYLFSIKAAVSFALYTILIPGMLHIMTKRLGYSSSYANLFGLRLSILLLLCGAILIGLSMKLWMLIIALALYSLGYGLSLFALSFITDLTIRLLDDAHVARTYSVVAFIETIGHTIGIPALTAAWVQGIKIGGWGLALPWWLSAALYGLIYIPAYCLKA
ncbi:major facilitator superfamily domain-containing protein [Xylaria sp. FL0933]|nr:major facilitator superfamily domain-containing protein [Xylaria sp. FL0933]